MKTTLTIIILLLCISVFPCSIFKYSDGNSIYFCGNEDWIASDPAIITIPSANNKLGVALLGWKSYLPSYPQAGINSAGLCFDWAMVPKQNYKRDKNLVDLDINSTIAILQKCKTVDDVIAYIQKYDFSHLAEEHIMFTDKTGMSCVIEYTKNERHIIVNSNEKEQHITNFNLTDRDSGGYPCASNSILEKELTKKNLTIENLSDLLNSVHHEGSYPTIYSYIFDLEKMRIRLFYNHQYTKYLDYSINELMTKKQTVDIK
jgi:hypothetical protein